jgi:hypothetical protein
MTLATVVNIIKLFLLGTDAIARKVFIHSKFLKAGPRKAWSLPFNWRNLR